MSESKLAPATFPTTLAQYKFWETNLLQSIAMVKTIPAKNLKLAVWLVGTVPTHADIHNGAEYHSCGTVACFGGWMTGWHYFKELGIRPSGLGAPELPHLKITYMDVVSSVLFGRTCMFDTRWKGEQHFNSDKEALMDRLGKRLSAVQDLILVEARQRDISGIFSICA